LAILLRALGPHYCESWAIGEDEKVKADSTTDGCFGIAETWFYLRSPKNNSQQRKS